MKDKCIYIYIYIYENMTSIICSNERVLQRVKRRHMRCLAIFIDMTH